MARLGYALFPAIAAVMLGTALSAQEAPAGSGCAPNPARELFTTAAAVTDPGVLMLNVGGQASYGRDGSEARSLPTEVDLGVCRWFDLRVGWSGPTVLQDPDGDTESGGGDPLFGGLVQVLRQGQAALDLGLVFWHKLPRASVAKGIGTGEADDSLLLAATRTWGCWELDVNAGASWLGRAGEDGTVRRGLAGLSVTRGWSGDWSVSVNTYALAATELGPRDVTGILAVSRTLSPSLTVDLGVEAGLSRSADRLAIDAGLVWRLGQFWGKD
jgi:hypothetical protein